MPDKQVNLDPPRLTLNEEGANAMLPLDGLLVVTLEQAVAGPMCTVRLADAGARVIKIERPGGETARHYDSVARGTSAYFAWLNRGKESCEMNIKEAGDRALLERMVAKADVFVRNIAPGAAARLDLDAQELARKYPRLICVDIFGYDQGTDYAKRLAYDMLIQAESGICAVTGTADEPVKVGVSMADITTGQNAYSAVLEALIERGITGRGKAIEIAMFDGIADMMCVPLLHYDFAGRETPRMGLAHSVIAPYGKVRCSDGDVVIVCQQHNEWVRFCTGVLEMPDLVEDARFATNADRVANTPELFDIIAGVFGKLPRGEAIARLDAHRLPWANVSTVADLSKHPALRKISVETPGGDIEVTASPLRDDIASRPVPSLGAHTTAIRREFQP
ncbi:CaiB/BaiF CoA-transferase family protein [Oceanicola sp. 22II-s10i]|uniref:CaiB/BaiF CoA transferase family protein n=1 Tax=Oceanicola sp. 22II-s10i TaxID=1317116 RepID=UPI0020CB8397|nr:CaiB/BaiF CoA-transferase family protein [Oceanicola sp. 22II-s10i]